MNQEASFVLRNASFSNAARRVRAQREIGNGRGAFICRSHGDGRAVSGVAISAVGLCAALRQVEERAMPLKALLRGFGPDVPENLQVTFYDDLPADVLCAQCDNVSAVLHRDPGGHGYCTSCKNMCTKGYTFECSLCKKGHLLSKLLKDNSPPAKICTKRVICPNTTERNAVHITFSALKVHLKKCSCFEVAHGTEDSANVPPVLMSSCSYCKREMPKKEIFQHVKDCKEKRKELHGTYDTCQQQSLSTKGPIKGETTFHQENPHRYTEADQEQRASLKVYATSADHDKPQDGTLSEINDIKSKIEELFNRSINSETKIYQQRNEITELKVALSEKDRTILQLNETLQMTQQDVKKLKDALAEREGDHQLLTETVNSHRIDMKNIETRCDKRHEDTEAIISSMKGLCTSLQEGLSNVHEEAKQQVFVVQQGLNNVNWSLTTALNNLGEECKQSKCTLEGYCHELNQLKACYFELKATWDNLVPQYFPQPQTPDEFRNMRSRRN